MTDTQANCKTTCLPEAQALVARSPRLALARAWQVDFVPFEFTLTGTFTAAGTPDPLLGLFPSKKIERDLLIYAIDVDIQTPNFATGDILKPEGDLAYDYTSGIQVRENFDGWNKRTTPYFPLKAVPKQASDLHTWCYLEEQSLTMDFSVTTPLPSAPTIITITFTAETPATDVVFRMRWSEALGELEKMGYCVDHARRVFCSSPS